MKQPEKKKVEIIESKQCKLEQVQFVLEQVQGRNNTNSNKSNKYKNKGEIFFYYLAFRNHRFRFHDFSTSASASITFLLFTQIFRTSTYCTRLKSYARLIHTRKYLSFIQFVWSLDFSSVPYLQRYFFTHCLFFISVPSALSLLPPPKSYFFAFFDIK